MMENLRFQFGTGDRPSKETIISAVVELQSMHAAGLLGGEVMPEDSNPGLPRDSAENFHYFTLPMALNYQRNSYSLWRSAQQTYADIRCREVFRPEWASKADPRELAERLLKFGVAVQPKRHVEIWRRLCETLVEKFDGDVRSLFRRCGWSIPAILQKVQVEEKAGFPYLSGPKICNYWLYVVDRYTSASFTGRESLSVAPDTHVIQATVKLGLVDEAAAARPDGRELVSRIWEGILGDTGILPIDVHTPLWLWSRRGFPRIGAR